MNKWIISLVMTLMALSIPDSLLAGEINTDKNNTAIEGYDPVAYFLENKAVKGISQYKLEWKGALWHFSTVKNRDLFTEHPELYAPQYGGHCANGLSDQHKVSGNPNIWLVQEGELFLFFSRRGRNAWINDTAEKRKQADLYWKSVQFQ